MDKKVVEKVSKWLKIFENKLHNGKSYTMVEKFKF
jgi:hypothetical protein